MATSFMDAQLPSDDEEDEDFDPDKKRTGGSGAGGKGGKGAKRGFMEVSDGEDDDAGGGGGGGDDAAAAGVHDMVAAGLADAMDDARYCAAAGPDEHDAKPAGDERRSCTAHTTGHPVWAGVPTPRSCVQPVTRHIPRA